MTQAKSPTRKTRNRALLVGFVQRLRSMDTLNRGHRMCGGLFAILAIMLFTAVHAWSHGAAPAPLNAIFTPEGQLVLVRTNIGMSVPSSAGRFTYLCPVLWGEEDSIPPVSGDSSKTLVMAQNGFVYRWDGCTFLPETLPDWEGEDGGNSQGIIMERRNGSTRFWDIRESSRILFEMSEGRVDSHIVDEGTVVLGVSRGKTRLFEWSERQGLQPVLIDGPVADYVSLRLAQPLFFVLSSIQGYSLYRLSDGRAVHIVDAERTIHGPVLLNGLPFVLVDGQLSRIVENRLEAIEQVDWTCLTSSNGIVTACKDRQLWSVELEGEKIRTDLLFRLDMLTGPDVSCFEDSDLVNQCTSQWIHFGAESGLTDFSVATPTRPQETNSMPGQSVPSQEATPSSGADGCDIGPINTLGFTPIWTFIMLFGFLRLRRTTPRVPTHL